MTGQLIVRAGDDADAFEDGPDRGRVLVHGGDTGGAYGLMELVVAPAAPGPAAYGAHLHGRCDETFFVLAGTLEFLLREEVLTLAVGDFVRVPAGVRHGYANVSGAHVKLLVGFHPAGLEALFLKYRSDGGRPADGPGFKTEAERLFGSVFDLDR